MPDRVLARLKTPLRDRWRLDRTYRLIHALQPAALIVNNHHHAPFPGEDYQTFERDLPGQNTMGYSSTSVVGKLPLEMSETMSASVFVRRDRSWRASALGT